MTHKTMTKEFWPGGVRLVVSVSMQFEAGGQSPKGTDSPFLKVDFPESVPSDAAANTWLACGYRERISVTSWGSREGHSAPVARSTSTAAAIHKITHSASCDILFNSPASLASRQV
jgi:hypothetical protein